MKYLVFTALLSLSVFSHALADPVRGDLDQANAAWPLIEAGALVIDVRSAEEFESGHLPGAINIPHDQTDAMASAIGNDPHRPVVLYCGSGRRAGMALDVLAEQGFDQVTNASGLDALKATQP